MKRIALVLLMSAVILVAGCMAGSNPSVHVPDPGGSVAGFWLGIWHGFIAPIAFIISLFADGVHFYDVHNNGWPYNLGFIIGICVLGGGGGSAARRRRR